jgi:predicted O-linked N-acetylglucosamine transferase (SPINDLY family)/glycosyltransferase involved in cell wall biosynthesis
MIPSYNPQPEYLAEALAGVLAAGMSEKEMQIEVVDNDSDSIDVAALVRSVACDRVSTFRQSSNVGGLENWNTCIRRARGQWVHVLHADDVVLPGFYQKLRAALEGNAEIGAAFCRHSHISAKGKPFYVSELERDTPGVLENWLPRLAVMQRIQCPCIVVRRSAYEKLGGFSDIAGSVLDWEMWLRVSAYYPVWYEPEILASYRVHGASGTSTLLKTAAVITDAGKLIDLAALYFPENQRETIVGLGKRHYALSAFGSALNLISGGQVQSGLAHLDAGLKLDSSPELTRMAEQILAKVPGTGAVVLAQCEPVANGAFFSSEEVENIERIFKSYQDNPAESQAGEQMRALRQGLGGFLAKAEPGKLEELFAANFGKIFRLVLKSGLAAEALTEEESAFAQSCAEGVKNGAFDLGKLQAYMLYQLAHSAPVPLELEKLPGWFFEDYLAYVFHSPQGFTRKGEAGQHCEHLLKWLRFIEERTRTAPDAARTMKGAFSCLEHLNVIPIYFTEVNEKELMAKRARIIEFVLEKNGATLDASFPKRSGRGKIRVGFLNADFEPRVETYTTLPSVYLDRSKFEISLFTLKSSPGPIWDHCQARADHLVQLPNTIGEQVKVLRKAGLDLLFICTNVTAVTNQIALLAAHRLAPLQILNYNSPLTSGFKHVDGYLSGTFAAGHGVQEYFSEKLFLTEGVPNCLEFSIDPQSPQLRFDRKSMGIPEAATVFVSGATCSKIIPEIQEIWAKILQCVPGSLLVLIPFNPNWSSAFPARQFERNLAEVFRRFGMGKERFVLAPSLPNRSEVMEFQKLGDIYLDTFPFTGSVSIIDPLSLGVPPVVWQSNTHRSRLAASLLRDLGIPEMVSSSPEEYVEIAVKLAKETEWRRKISAEIRRKMALGPSFLDCANYGRQVGALIERLLHNPQNPAANMKRSGPDASMELKPNESLIDAAVRLHMAGQFAQAEELYRQILTANPHNPDAWHLLGVLAHQCGNHESAVEFIEQALSFVSDNPVFWNNLGEACHAKGEERKAIESCRRALELKPDFAEAMIALANALRPAGEVDEAMALYAKALRINPDHAEGLLQYGLALYGEQRFKEASSTLKRACAAAPDSVEACFYLGVAFEECQRYSDALSCYEKASKLNPSVGVVWNRWGKLLNSRREFSKAVIILKEAVRCNPEDPDYNYNFGHALQMTQRSAQALEFFNKAIELGGNTPELHNNQGILLKNEGRFFEAAESFHRALSLKPEMISALNNLGAVCADMGLTSEALECVQLLIAKRPDLPSAHNNLGKLLKDSGRADEALNSYKRSIELDPDAPGAHHNLLLCLNYISGRDARENFELHRAWGQRMANMHRDRFRWTGRDDNPGRKLRIGYVSSDFCQHPVALFIEAIFSKSNRQDFELIAYSDCKSPDSVTDRLKALVEVWHTTRDFNDRELAQMIWTDEIDILVDLGGHTAWNRLEMFALKPAPVQVSYLGYPATTGLQTIDYRITDCFADPIGSSEHLYTERLLHLPRCAWCYLAPETAPSVVPPPLAQEGCVTFGCFNNLAKLNPGLLDLWAGILKRVPGSRLKLKAKTLHDPVVQRDLIAHFAQHGIEESRLEISGFSVTVRGHMGEYSKVDIALDSFPYHGTTTTCEALWMGVPVVSLAGDTHVSRVGVSLLNAVELGDLIATTPEGYIQTAVDLALAPERLSSLRTGMRARMQASPLMDQPSLAMAMDQAFRQMWRDFVAKRSARGK